MSFFFFLHSHKSGFTNAPVIVAANATILGGKRILTSEKQDFYFDA